MTPEAVHYGRANQIRAARREVLLQAYASHPERFVRKPPEPPLLPQAAWINPPRKKTTLEDASEATISTPVDTWGPLKTDSLNRSQIAADIVLPRPEGPKGAMTIDTNFPRKVSQNA